MNKKSRSNNPEGRPTEYQSEMKKVLVPLPVDYLEWIDSIAEQNCTSRARLLNEHLGLIRALYALEFIKIDEYGTEFANVPRQTHNKKKNQEHSAAFTLTAKRDRVTKELFET
ncbi:hypothetical protein V6x_26960 [Gimesia chilikensis]|uniref:Uncharacterized protein n=1 Tax=Gimesia chilikensis TaxID=2605989 RepID=A0A517WCK9_9PLAN|nr:hypothetical protein [Gimesia chilikensis]QDU02987.1 hypothetical protein V6x_26960 [Gimesia chilikensis]